MHMTRQETIDAAIDAGALAASLKTDSKFDITNDAYRGAYVRRIREAISAELVKYPNLGAYTDTHFDRYEDLAREEGFQIGVFDRLAGTIVGSRFVRFESVDFTIGDGPIAV